MRQTWHHQGNNTGTVTICQTRWAPSQYLSACLMGHNRGWPCSSWLLVSCLLSLSSAEESEKCQNTPESRKTRHFNYRREKSAGGGASLKTTCDLQVDGWSPKIVCRFLPCKKKLLLEVNLPADNLLQSDGLERGSTSCRRQLGPKRAPSLPVYLSPLEQTRDKCDVSARQASTFCTLHSHVHVVWVTQSRFMYKVLKVALHFPPQLGTLLTKTRQLHGNLQLFDAAVWSDGGMKKCFWSVPVRMKLHKFKFPSNPVSDLEHPKPVLFLALDASHYNKATMLQKKAFICL